MSSNTDWAWDADPPLTNTYWDGPDMEEPETWQETATKEFPEDQAEIAIQKYAHKHKVEGVFWVEGGKRFVWGPDITNSHFSAGKPLYIWGSDGRAYVPWENEPTLKVIDRPRPPSYTLTIRHPSFKGWNLPKEHPRHFLKFPKEIQQLIFHFAITVSGPDMVEPQTIHSNWKTEIRNVTYHRHINHSPRCDPREGICRDHPQERPYLAICQRHDTIGPYTKMHYVPRPDIDSTFLRTSKQFYDMGLPILYSKNEFFFPMVNAYRHESPPTMLPGSEIVHRPEPVFKPRLSEEDFDTAFNHIDKKISRTELPGWMYYDHFIRFLHTIGKKNAALIKSVRFSGTARIHHNCVHELCGKEGCDEDLVAALEVYIPFIRRFCTGLERLSVEAIKDYTYERGVANGFIRAITDGPMITEEVFSPLLEELKTIDNLKELSIIDDSYDSADMGLAFADETVKWVTDRAATRKREQREAYAKAKAEEVEIARLTIQVREQNVHCGFCGEGHIWAECWNLCDFCGAFGHFWKACPEGPPARDADE
ncbi:uncharacterized protein PAC_13954 [Phialocephala subalpina]|uniref:CCHC-type domain-containing protein n=1 Tax=Phialocephala subalpina TaxID=576137 RepID=A0A1L7XGI2_9HELO|nr:uncharacterized protein PAC_13954 [Phialocephala subalpina]